MAGGCDISAGCGFGGAGCCGGASAGDDVGGCGTGDGCDPKMQQLFMICFGFLQRHLCLYFF